MRAPIMLIVAVSSLMLAACSSSDEHRDPETAFSALSGTSLDDTATVTGVGDGILMFREQGAARHVRRLANDL